MLSILIPSYNVDLTALVTPLLEQARALALPFEIIVMDDASPDMAVRERNQRLQDAPEVLYLQQQTNNGRAKLRNKLVQQARFPYLVLMDCDAGIVDSSYLSCYWQYVQEHPELPSRYVIAGGLMYRSEKPAKERLLRWKYGKQREVRPAVERNKHPYRSFTPFNIFTTRETFVDNGFDESLTTYGYEDTLWGYQLKQQEIPLVHIDNPLFHDGLDTNEAFLRKTREAIENLYRLMQEERLPKEFEADSRLLRAYRNFERKGSLPICSWYYQTSHKLMEASLKQAPSLRVMDSYKLFYLAYLSRK